ncbi:TrbI/VirB10 family protein [uncultured Roseobacter sp.]|uniref:TrbI/VirB10 family protein n=1 Tax=uncultured Roseobacter sp. TaxID=114847 RepID=UPI00263A3CFF|nr:TrbI/VirB10 family protein [uncultured Roseobacter sp.]
MSDIRKGKQWAIVAVCAGIVLATFYGMTRLLSFDTPEGVRLQEASLTRSMVARKTDGASPEMSWVTNGRSRVEKLEQTNSRLERALATFEDQAEKRIDAITTEYDDELLRVQGEVEALKAVLVEQSGRAGRIPSAPGLADDYLRQAVVASPMTQLNGGDFIQAPLGQGQPTGPGAPPPLPGGGGGFQPATVSFDRQFQLTPMEARAEMIEEDAPTFLENYLPAGSYAPATVLSGVDASTGVTSQGEPIPVIFRITGHAVTAGTRSTRGHKVNLTGCTVTGSARGDLSSERVYVRLIKMSCIKDNREVFEADVAGYMSGSGKTGSRGLVTSREGPLIRSAGIAGALGGLAGGLQSVATAGAKAEQAGFEDVLQSAGAGAASGGISGAADRLANYYIQRAEQYQPVVSLYGGTEVELVFMEGVKLD